MAVATSFVTAIAAIPFWLGILGGSFHVPVPMGILMHAILTVLILPMVLGYLTRLVLLRLLGESGFKRLAPLFPSITLVSMYLIIFLIFFMKASLLVQKWQLMLWLIVPNLLFVSVTLAVITWLDRRLGLNYEDHMGIIFASTGKNNGTAIALATAAFSPLVAVPAATLPIFQIIFLVGYLKLEKWVRHYFGAPIAAPAAAPAPGLAPIPAETPVAVAAGRGIVPFNRILFTTDFSPYAEAAKKIAITLAKNDGQRLWAMTVLRPVDEPMTMADEPAEIPAPEWENVLAQEKQMLKKEEERRLDQDVAEIEASGVSVTKIVREGDPAKEIVTTAKEIGADLIVMGSHGQRTLWDVVLGSTAEKVAKEAPCPVLIVSHPPQQSKDAPATPSDSH